MGFKIGQKVVCKKIYEHHDRFFGESPVVGGEYTIEGFSPYDSTYIILNINKDFAFDGRCFEPLQLDHEFAENLLSRIKKQVKTQKHEL